MAAETLISEQTAAVTVAVGFSITIDDVPATIIATNLAGTETVPILFKVAGDIGSTEAASQEGTAVTLTATDNIKTINSPMRLAVTKPTTASAAGVFLARRERV